MKWKHHLLQKALANASRLSVPLLLCSPHTSHTPHYYLLPSTTITYNYVVCLFSFFTISLWTPGKLWVHFISVSFLHHKAFAPVVPLTWDILSPAMHMVHFLHIFAPTSASCKGLIWIPHLNVQPGLSPSLIPLSRSLNFWFFLLLLPSKTQHNSLISYLVYWLWFVSLPQM